MRELSLTLSQGPMVFAATLLIIFLTLADTFLTLYLVDHGAVEWNPILAYYLGRSDLLFFAVKYLLTCASIILVLSVTKTHVFRETIPVKALLVVFIVALAAVLKWQLFLLHRIAG
jgi:hypothetical protein